MIATYEKTIFKDESSGFCICGYRTADETVPLAARRPDRRDGKIHFTATGCLLPETGAIEVELFGRWEKSRYGPQLAVEHYREIMPTTETGIIAYLSSGFIKGIGPKTARLLVDAFGLSTLDVLDKTPERLLTVKGIAARKLQRIVDTYAAAGVEGGADHSGMDAVFPQLLLHILVVHTPDAIVIPDQRAVHNAEPVGLQRPGKTRVGGRVQQHLIPLAAEHPQRRDKAADHAVFIADLRLGQPVDAVAVPLPVGNRRIIGRRGQKVAESRVLHPFAQRLNDTGRGGKVHVGDPERDRVKTGFGRVRRHAGNQPQTINGDGIFAVAVHNRGEIVFQGGYISFCITVVHPSGGKRKPGLASDGDPSILITGFGEGDHPIHKAQANRDARPAQEKIEHPFHPVPGVKMVDAKQAQPAKPAIAFFIHQHGPANCIVQANRLCAGPLEQVWLWGNPVLFLQPCQLVGRLKDIPCGGICLRNGLVHGLLL